MKSERIKSIGIVLIIVLISVIIVFCDYYNVITRLGLSVSLWSSMVSGAFPIALTIYLFYKEKKERMEQVNEESRFQKKLIVRTAYINYFEELLEQINRFMIFLECYILNDEDLMGRKRKEEIKIRSLITAIILEKDKKVWELDYKVYPFKSIDIDIMKYNYKENVVNMRAFMPYIKLKNKLNKIYYKEELCFEPNGNGYRKKLNEEDIKNVALDILKKKEEVKVLYDFLEEVKKDIEERIVFT